MSKVSIFGKIDVLSRTFELDFAKIFLFLVYDYDSATAIDKETIKDDQAAVEIDSQQVRGGITRRDRGSIIEGLFRLVLRLVNWMQILKWSLSRYQTMLPIC